MVDIKKIKNILNNMSEIEFAYLFGSYAKDSFCEQSDIDIAIYIKKEFNIFDTKLKVHHKLEIALNKKIDIVALNTIKNYNLLEDILSYNVILKDSKNDERVMFELKKEHEILDYKAFKRMIDVA